MTPEQEIKILKEQVRGLLEWKEAREKQQLTLPLDYNSLRALDNAFREFKFTKILVSDIYFQATTDFPRVKGQMRYYDDLTNQNFRCCTTTNPPDGADFEGRILLENP